MIINSKDNNQQLWGKRGGCRVIIKFFIKEYFCDLQQAFKVFISSVSDSGCCEFRFLLGNKGRENPSADTLADSVQ